MEGEFYPSKRPREEEMEGLELESEEEYFSKLRKRGESQNVTFVPKETDLQRQYRIRCVLGLETDDPSALRNALRRARYSESNPLSNYMIHRRLKIPEEDSGICALLQRFYTVDPEVFRANPQAELHPEVMSTQYLSAIPEGPRREIELQALAMREKMEQEGVFLSNIKYITNDEAIARLLLSFIVSQPKLHVSFYIRRARDLLYWVSIYPNPDTTDTCGLNILIGESGGTVQSRQRHMKYIKDTNWPLGSLTESKGEYIETPKGGHIYPRIEYTLFKSFHMIDIVTRLIGDLDDSSGIEISPRWMVQSMIAPFAFPEPREFGYDAFVTTKSDLIPTIRTDEIKQLINYLPTRIDEYNWCVQST